MKNKFVYLVTIVLAVLYLAAGHYFAVQGLSFFKEKSPTDVVEARVVKLLPAAAGAKFEQIRFEAELLSGRQEGVKVTAAQNKAGSFAVGRDVAVGDKVLLLPGQSSQGEWSYAEHLRSNVLMWLFAVFCFKYYRFWTDAGRKYFDLSDFLLPVNLCSFCTGDTVRQERLLLDDPDLCFYCRD